MRSENDSRWKLTFAFGLVHGFGFAGALQELGIGAAGIGIAVPLGAFNVGRRGGPDCRGDRRSGRSSRACAQAPLARFHLARVCSLLVVTGGAYWLVARIVTI